MLDTELGYNLFKKTNHEVQNQMKLSTSDRMTFLLPDHEWRVSLLLQFDRRKFQNHEYKIDQSIEFSQSATYWVGELDSKSPLVSRESDCYTLVGNILSVFPKHL